MKPFRRLLCLIPALLCLATLPARALDALDGASLDEQHSYRIEVLQVTDIEPFDQAYGGFLQALASQGIVEGRNLIVHRKKIDFDLERGGFWDRLGVLFRIRSEALRIATAKPDLVLTIGTPATKYARGILEEARIPVVFTAVANPLDAGCPSLVDAGAGVTGATLYTDMATALKVVHQVFPGVQRIGMVHSDDENGLAHVGAAAATAREVGLSVAAREVAKRDSIVPSLKELAGGGAQLFAVPLDAYYGLRKYEPTTDLSDFSAEHRIPVVAFALVRVPGAVLYAGADFTEVGRLSGKQAGKILARRMKPEILPILRQEKPTVLFDPRRAASLQVALPPALAQGHVEREDGFWQLAAKD